MADFKWVHWPVLTTLRECWLRRLIAIRRNKATDLLQKENVVIFEAAIRFENLFIRIDVLKKTGNKVALIEVKSKSFDPREHESFYNQRELKNGVYQILSAWDPYVYDVTFQTYVLRKAHPEYHVVPYLYLADKSRLTTVEGLNQKFFLTKTPDGKSDVVVEEGLTRKQLGDEILIKVDICGGCRANYFRWH